jgi:hypothetical protein
VVSRSRGPLFVCVSDRAKVLITSDTLVVGGGGGSPTILTRAIGEGGRGEGGAGKVET